MWYLLRKLISLHTFDNNQSDHLLFDDVWTVEALIADVKVDKVLNQALDSRYDD